jgi:hypothetical protein
VSVLVRLKSLRDQTNALKAAGDPRCRDQIMADTLVERLTGQAHAADVNAELQIVIGLDALLDAKSRPRRSWTATDRCRLSGPRPVGDQQRKVVVALALRCTRRWAVG